MRLCSSSSSQGAAPQSVRHAQSQWQIMVASSRAHTCATMLRGLYLHLLETCLIVCAGFARSITCTRSLQHSAAQAAEPPQSSTRGLIRLQTSQKRAAQLSHLAWLLHVACSHCAANVSWAKLSELVKVHGIKGQHALSSDRSLVSIIFAMIIAAITKSQSHREARCTVATRWQFSWGPPRLAQRGGPQPYLGLGET